MVAKQMGQALLVGLCGCENVVLAELCCAEPVRLVHHTDSFRLFRREAISFLPNPHLAVVWSELDPHSANLTIIASQGRCDPVLIEPKVLV